MWLDRRLFQASSSVENPQTWLFFPLYLRVPGGAVILVCCAVTVRGSTHTTQEVKNPKQLLGRSGRWRFVDISGCLELKQANLD